jgi:hypothetical protein
VNAGRRLRLIEKNLGFAALDVRRVVKSDGLEGIIGLGRSHAILEPGKIAHVKDGGGSNENHYAEL